MVFTSQRTKIEDGYAEMNDSLWEDAQKLDGFIGSESLSKIVFGSQKLEAATLVVVEIDYKDGKLNWIGSHGPEWGIRSGTIASAKILYERRLPISYVIPWLSKLTGLDNF